MKSMGVNEIREKFLSFFESKGCLRLGSFPLIPKNDASLLLINSGMAPMKPWFQNPETAPKRRVTTCQKCIRTGDIENVGKTARHGTFFEMLGNFSFGDYFKKEATAWAWEFFTKVMEIPQERLWISVYEEDDEARDIWVNEVGVDPAHIVKLGKEDNFWEHGTGPCGPCSEIYFDRGEEYGCGEPGCGVGCECDRFMEVWNLVFTQFDKDEDGNVTGTTNVSFAISFNTARFENADQINAFGGKNGVLSGLHYKKQNLVMIGTVKNDLLGALQSAAANTNEAIQVHEVVKGPAYTIFMLADSRFWGYVDVASTSLGNGIEAYGIHVMW